MHSLIPLLQGIVHPAGQILRISHRGAALREGTEQRQRFIRLAGLQGLIGLGKRLGCRCLRGPRDGSHGREQPHSESTGYRAQSDCRTTLHGTTLIGTPSCKGCPVVVPVATQSPSFSPLMMAALVRLVVPVTTGVRTRLLFTTLKT